MDLEALLRTLTAAPGPPGSEAEVRQVIQSVLTGLDLDLKVDSLGNLIAHRAASAKDGKRILLSAHMDEIGLILTHQDRSGFGRLAPLGKVVPPACPGSLVQFLNGSQAVIGISSEWDPSHQVDLDDLHLDFGRPTGAPLPVQIGALAVFQQPLVNLGEFWLGHALDNRLGVAILIKTLQRLEHSPYDIFCVFSAQEQVGARGAGAAAYMIRPDLALVIDVTASDEIPTHRLSPLRSGQGPGILVKGKRMISDRRMVDWMVRTAENANIPYQLLLVQDESIEANPIQLSRAGVATGSLLLPCRNIHTTTEMISHRDGEYAVQLLLQLLSHPVELK